jgi:WD40 repeat protein
VNVKLKFVWKLVCVVLCVLLMSIGFAGAKGLPQYQEIIHLGQSPLDSIAWKPDGSELAVTTSDALFFYTATFEQISTFPIPYYAEEIAWSPDGTRLASSGLWVFDRTTGQAQILDCADSPDRCTDTHLVWSPDGARIVSGGTRRNARVWDALSGDMLANLEHTDWVSDVAWSPDGVSIATASHDGTVYIWNSGTYELTGTLSSENISSVASIAWSIDNRYLTVGHSESGEINVWDAASEVLVATLTGHTDTVSSLVWSSDSSQLVSGSWDNTLRVWNTDDWQLQYILEEHTNNVRFISMSPQNTLASVGADNAVRLWNMSTGQLMQTFENFSFQGALVWSPDSDKVAATGTEGQIGIWQVDTGENIGYLRSANRRYNSLFWFPNSDLLASTEFTNAGIVIDIWQAVTLENIQAIEIAGQVCAIAWNSQGTALALLRPDGSIEIWDTTTWQARLTWPYAESITSCAMAWSPDSAYIAVAELREGGAVNIFDVTTGETFLSWEAGDQMLYSVIWSPHGDQIMVGQADSSGRGEMRVFDSNTGEYLWNISSLVEIAWHPTENLFASDQVYDPDSDNPYAINIFGRDSETRIALIGHTSGISVLKWSPNGRMLASGSQDYTVRIWG